MARFFMTGTNIFGGRAVIRGQDAEHIRVLRMRPGEDVVICDGKGTDYRCRLVSSGPEEAEAEVLEVVPCRGEPRVEVTVYAGLPKGERADFLVQKCIEAGASGIVFFNCERCVARPDGRSMEKKLERFSRIAEAAAQQSAARPDTPLFQAIDAMAESVQRDIASFPAWPLALKAEYARGIAPRVRAIVDSGDLTPLDNGAGPNLYVIAAAAYDYGLPGEGDLAQEDALERARETVRERFGLSQEALSRYTDVLVYFDATDPDAPLWRFVFQPEMDARDALGQTQYDLRYRVEIASPAGDVASAEAFKRQVPIYDLSYLKNLY